MFRVVYMLEELRWLCRRAEKGGTVDVDVAMPDCFLALILMLLADLVDVVVVLLILLVFAAGLLDDADIDPDADADAVTSQA